MLPSVIGRTTKDHKFFLKRPEKEKNKLNSAQMATNESSTQQRIENARRTVVNGTHVLEICDDIGTCWHDLGIRLKLPPAILVNIDADRTLCREKAREMLYEWMKREGSSATVGSLADSLERIENRRVAQKLLDFQLNVREEAERDDARNSRSRTRHGDGNPGNASGVRYGSITIGPNSNVNFIENQQDCTNVYVTKKE